MKYLTLNQMKKGIKARIIKFEGGYGLEKKLDALGVRKDKVITKISNSFIGGPVTIEIGNNTIAIGQGMATKIVVEVIE